MLAAPGVACVLGHEQTDWSGSLHSHEAAQLGVVVTDCAQSAGPPVPEHGGRQHVPVGVTIGAAHARVGDLDGDAAWFGLGEPFGGLVA